VRAVGQGNQHRFAAELGAASGEMVGFGFGERAGGEMEFVEHGAIVRESKASRAAKLAKRNGRG